MSIKCKQCGERFARPWVHQGHRVTTDGPISPMRCLTADEMVSEKNYRKVGGTWVTAFRARVGGTKAGMCGFSDARASASARYVARETRNINA